MSTLIKLRRDTAANWATANPVLQLGEPGYDTTNNQLRIGNGTTPWSGLTPIAGGGGGGLPLANGSSNFDIATAGGNATITVDGTNTWTFDTTGVFTPADDIRVGATGGRYIQDCIDGTTSMRWYNIDSEGESQLVRAYTGDALTENDIERGKISINWTSNTDSGVTVTAFSTDVGNAQTESVWAFQGDGNFVAPGNIIAANNIVSTSLRTNLTDFNWSETISNISLGNTTTVTLSNNVFGDPWSGQVVITDVTGTTQANDTWWYEAVDANQFALYTDSTLSTPVNSSGWSAYTGGGFATTLGYANIEINGQNVTIRSDHGDYNNKIWRFDRTGQTVFPYMDVARGDNPSGNITGYALIMGDGTNEAIISTPDGNINGSYSSQRLVINPGKGGDGTSGEGGDIYLWAGRGGDSGGSGGDIKIRGGQGGTDNGQGGYIRMEGGDGDSSGGAPGFIEITGGGGGAGQIGGYVRIQGGQGATYGGDANVSGGTGQSGPGGPVNIIGGVSGNGLAEYGNVNIIAGASTWTFDNVGNTTLPAGGSIQTAPGSNGNINIHPDGTGSIMIKGGTDTLLNLSSDVANTVNRIEVDTYGNTATLGGAFIGRFARGTPGSYAPVQAEDRLAVFGGLGYADTGFSFSARGRVTIDAAENWTDSAQGTHVSIWTTAIGNTTPVESARFGAGQNFVLYAGNITVGNGRVTSNLVNTVTRVVADLPSPAVATAGSRSFVTDADSRTWGNVVVGGAGNAVPVWTDGSDWYIG